MRKPKKTGIILQIYITVLIGLLIVSGLTYYSQHKIADESINNRARSLAIDASYEVIDTIREYPASDWLIKYWYDHASELDIEYDVDYITGTETKEKYRQLSEHQPGLTLHYAAEADLEALPAEDQKLAAEVVYSWILTRLNEIKKTRHPDFLYIVVTDTDGAEHPYETQFFLFSAGYPGAVRSEGDVFPIGKIISVPQNRTLQDTMRNVVANQENENGYMEYSGRYADCYSFLSSFDGHAALTGVSYEKSGLSNDISKQARNGAFNAFVFQFLLINILLFQFYLFGIRPLETVTNTIRRYTEDKDSRLLKESLTSMLHGTFGFMIRANEFGELSENLISMSSEIDNYVEEIEAISAKNERYRTELQLAESIQFSALPTEFPPFPERTEFDIYALMDPAREIGGDFYDFFMLDENRLGLVIADVAGKGIPAALFMMLGKQIVESYAMVLDSPAEIIEMSNNALCKSNANNMFITVWIGILDLATGVLTATNAGHEYPVIKNPGEEFRMLKDRHGFVIGDIPDMTYENYTLQLPPGTILFVYSDGVPESTNTSMRMFGTSRLVDSLNSAETDDPEYLVHRVLRDVEAFAGEAEQFDDMTMLCLRYHGPKTSQDETSAQKKE